MLRNNKLPAQIRGVNMIRYDQSLENKGVKMRRNDRVHKSLSPNQFILYAHLSGVSIVQNIQYIIESNGKEAILRINGRCY